ncbi:hypothetical protein D3C83_10830 [compost metagenome]
MDDRAYLEPRDFAVGDEVGVVVRLARRGVKLAVFADIVDQPGLHEITEHQHVGERGAAQGNAIQGKLAGARYALERLAELGDQADHALGGDHIELQQFCEIDELDLIGQRARRRHRDRRIRRRGRVDGQVQVEAIFSARVEHGQRTEWVEVADDGDVGGIPVVVRLRGRILEARQDLHRKIEGDVGIGTGGGTKELIGP